MGVKVFLGFRVWGCGAFMGGLTYGDFKSFRVFRGFWGSGVQAVQLGAYNGA